MGVKVEKFDDERGVCDLRDEKTGKKWQAPCEPTGRNRHDNREEVSMETQTYQDAGQEFHAKIEQYMDKAGCSYAEAMRFVAWQNRDLARRYSHGESDAGAKFDKAAGERERRVGVYADHFNTDTRRAETMVDEHDPKMRNIPLDAGSVVAARTEERMAKGARNYGETMRAVLADDPQLAACYNAGKPYIEAAKEFIEDPMRSREIRAITEPRPDAVATSTGMPEGEFTNTSRLRLAALLAGAKATDGGIDIPLALQIAGLVPDEVRAAAGEALDEIARSKINSLSTAGQASGQTSSLYPQGYRLAVAEHPELAAASQTGALSEDGLRDLFPQWFSN